MAGKWTDSNPATNMNIAAETLCNDFDESDTEEQLAADENNEHIAAATHINDEYVTEEQLAAEGNNVQRSGSTQPPDVQVYHEGSAMHDRPLYEDMPNQTSNKEPLRDTNKRSQQGAENTYSDADDSRFDAMSEQNRILLARIESFQSSPLRDMAEQLGNAGFYYTGKRDECVCFACGGIIKNWKPSDDPWIRHSQRYPNCPFLKQEKGEYFIKLIIQNSSGQESDDETSHDTFESTVVQLIEQLVIENRQILILDMGFSEEQVRCAVRDLVEQGHADVKIDNIVERIETNLDTTVEHEATDTSTEDKVAENIRLKTIVLCVSCKTRRKEVMFLPCCHARLCVRCSHNLVRCPKCDKHIANAIRIYTE
ncbi:baculoviral IAP repeat-containing protein 8-like isoform X2 [Dreissena polymorpha]|nr:baculoviral IAP repeat-containing protein 8-like isoform X2 [Dreissena polymorpha]XP_052240609.1 baculoviral IAP repeat-containing protein 8-like isoform X2 [Dreissena polymorpha]XP_052240610.1 baculoviral IAP repeat-containing protein 8-like isoform X2 [Dreissena polymorpha]XP_052240611.1 baculoviral IAP repeat-containing protein 8-like isoform X2 [Dreissena polymorpha]XP_052240612.1 baculoviral IAP repeat-containing protein 8-like isoform X2 [Dreissena polymorpha]XP_052240613.1 baculovira